MKHAVILTVIGIMVAMSAHSQQKVNFPSGDGINITADLYEISDDAPMIVLCHQARWSRGEYGETAKWLNQLGYNCLAIDQRSGDAVFDVTNETNAEAKKAGKSTDYLDALPDIVAAVNYASSRHGAPVILVGSSYSAALVLKVAKDSPGVLAVASFSPGEYFGKKLKLGDAIAGLSKPAFFTSTLSEKAGVKALADRCAPGAATFYLPDFEGYHGSRALWTSKEGHEKYRKAFLDWLMGLPK